MSSRRGARRRTTAQQRRRKRKHERRIVKRITERLDGPAVRFQKMRDMVQAAGRGMRGPTSAPVVIIDSTHLENSMDTMYIESAPNGHSKINRKTHQKRKHKSFPKSGVLND